MDCPSCGAPRSLTNPGIVTFVCEYCNTPVYWQEDSVRAAGETSLLSEGFTRLYRGATGSYRRKRFRVLGRVRYDHGSGFTDEWFLELAGGESAWMTEDDHRLAVQRNASVDDARSFAHYSLGMTLRFRDLSGHGRLVFNLTTWGAILHELDALNLTASTAVVFHADHGWAAAEWICLVRDMLVRDQDGELHLGAGLPPP